MGVYLDFHFRLFIVSIGIDIWMLILVAAEHEIIKYVSEHQTAVKLWLAHKHHAHKSLH